jgi:hypothetical protein
LPFTPSTAGFEPDVIAAIIGRDETVLDGAASSAGADTLLKSNRDMASLRDFIALL